MGVDSKVERLHDEDRGWEEIGERNIGHLPLSILDIEYSAS